MDIAQQKRVDNVAEYVLYLWQLEDLLRALQFSPQAVFEALVAPRDADEKWKLAALEWYMDIASLLEKEEKTESGHIDHTLHIIADLNDLHLTLLRQSTEDPGEAGNGSKTGNRSETKAGNGSKTGGETPSAAKDYRELFSRLAPELPRLRELLGRDDVSDIELSFRALYGAMLYRMKGMASPDKNPGGTTAGIARQVTELVSPVIALLSDIYHRVEVGELDLYKD